MPGNVYFKKIKREDGRYVFVGKSKGNDVPIILSANSYSSLDDCDLAIEGLAPEHDDEEE
jgi:uncharacterized protein YegP (UPF0339 family)